MRRPSSSTPPRWRSCGQGGRAPSSYIVTAGSKTPISTRPTERLSSRFHTTRSRPIRTPPATHTPRIPRVSAICASTTRESLAARKSGPGGWGLGPGGCGCCSWPNANRLSTARCEGDPQTGVTRHRLTRNRHRRGIGEPVGAWAVGIDLSRVAPAALEEREWHVEGARLFVGDRAQEPLGAVLLAAGDDHVVSDLPVDHARRVPIHRDVLDELERRLALVILRQIGGHLQR